MLHDQVMYDADDQGYTAEYTDSCNDRAPR